MRAMCIRPWEELVESPGLAVSLPAAEYHRRRALFIAFSLCQVLPRAARYAGCALGCTPKQVAPI